MAYGSTQFTVIASGSKVSTPGVMTHNLRGAAMQVPTIASGQLILLGSVNDVLFTRAVQSGGNVQFATGPGSVCAAITDQAMAFSSVAVESTVAVTAPTTISIWSKP